LRVAPRSYSGGDGREPKNACRIVSSGNRPSHRLAEHRRLPNEFLIGWLVVRVEVLLEADMEMSAAIAAAPIGTLGFFSGVVMPLIADSMITGLASFIDSIPPRARRASTPVAMTFRR
jgi:hypothetical protein